MKILFTTAHPYLPQMYGGLQTSTDELCHRFLERGHDVAVLAGLMPGGWLAWQTRLKMQINRRLSGCKVSRDTGFGYPVWRTWFPWDAVGYVAARERPDVIVVLAMKPVRMARAAQATRIPVLMTLQDVEFSQHDGRFEDLGNIPCVANSHFTAETYRVTYGVEPVVIYPFVAPEKYKIETTRENVTFVNPVPVKGCDLALEIARLCPEIPFTFVEGWPLTPKQRMELMQKLATLANVTLLPPQKDMRRVYGKCKILLVPSLWEEAYGLIATEAQVSGIPVIASQRGGLAEAIGPGGIQLDPEGSIDAWVNVVRKLWRDDKYYAELSVAARAYAQRPEMSVAHHIEQWEKALKYAKTRLA